MSRRHVIGSILLGLLAFAIDRGQKFLQVEVLHWRGGESVPVAPFLDYVLVWNTGVSYSLFNTLPPILLGVVAVVAMLALAVWWWRTGEPLVRFGLALCLGGALSNAVDRWLYGAVADFFYFHWQDWSFYVFNLADGAITLGVLLLILDLSGLVRRKPVETQ